MELEERGGGRRTVEKGERGGEQNFGACVRVPKNAHLEILLPSVRSQTPGGKEEEKMGRNTIFALLFVSNCVFSDGLHHHCQGGFNRSGKRIDAL